MHSGTLAPELGELQEQAAYWRSQCADAIENQSASEAELAEVRRRLGIALGDVRQRTRWHQQAQLRVEFLEGELEKWKSQWRLVEARLSEQDRIAAKEIERLREEVRQRDEELRRLRGQLRQRGKDLFGRKSEQRESGALVPAQEGEVAGARRKPRGRRKGRKGYGGRKLPENLPVVSKTVACPDGPPTCPQCQRAYQETAGREDSHEIDWRQDVVLVRYERVKYRKGCACSGVAEIVTAPVPAKLIPKGKFSTGFWVELMTQKYFLQTPVCRILTGLRLGGVKIAKATVNDGLKKIHGMMDPVYQGMLARSRQAHHWWMDETGWKVFEDKVGKKTHNWWLWACITQEVVCYLLDPFRSAQVILKHLGKPEGILNCDRYRAYESSVLGSKLVLALCWAHLRRDFLRVEAGYPELTPWCQGWVVRIDKVFAVNRRRREAKLESARFGRLHRRLERQMEAMQRCVKRELAGDELQEAQRKVLASLERNWAGYAVFVGHPEIPMDNNEAERYLRNPVLGRKNYNGSGAEWAGHLAAALFTIIQTFLKWKLNPRCFFQAYFRACAENGGKAPETIEPFLPWNLDEETRKEWALHPT